MAITAGSPGSPRFRHTGTAHFLIHECLTLNLNNALLMHAPLSYTHRKEGTGLVRFMFYACCLILSTDALGAGITDRYSAGNFGFKSSSNHSGTKSILLNCFIIGTESVQADYL